MAIKLKTGVTPPNLILLAALANAHHESGAAGYGPDLVITSGNDGLHMEGSQHYRYAALDVRSKTFHGPDKLPFVRAVIARLGTPVPVETPTGHGYQTSNRRWLGILEQEGRVNEHFHFELNV